VKLFGNSPQAISLLGEVYTQTLDGKEKARRLFEKALHLDPNYLHASLLLSDIEVEANLLDVAIKRLKQVSQLISSFGPSYL
jgi:cytochrome c-type biogenesis protein CcmH/NrfG